MGCMDRVLILKDGKEEPGEIVNGDQLRAYGIKWYAEKRWKA
jgi:hypothetical protein